MAIYRKDSGSWTTVRNIYRKSGGVWTSVENVYRRASGVWNSVFLRNNSPVIQNKVTISSNVSIITDGEFATFTGRNYSWTPTSGLTLTYRFEKSTSITFASPILISSGAIANPASGSSNTVTQTVYPSAFSQTDMYFRFKVTAVNSSGTTISVSDIVGVSYIATPAPELGSPSITGSTTVGNNAFGNIGVWTGAPTSYSYRWYFMSGATSYPLTFSQSRSVSNKSLSGFTATITTSAPHGYKTSDITIITSMDSLFNKSSATISSVTSNSFSYSINPPTAWADAGTGYSTGTYVSYSGSVYSASSTISSSSPYNGGTMYSSGAIVYSGTNRYQSNLNNNIGNSVTNPIYWNPLGNFAPGGSLWTLQNFSNVAASGTITGPNYYEGTTASSTSFLLNVPATDYKSQLNMIDKALYFGVKAYNSVTPSPSEYSNYKLVYGFPIITLGTPTYPAGTQAQIPFTHSYMTKYNIDVTRAGISHTGYPAIITSSTSPINISALTAGLTYTVNVYPINGEDTYGNLKTTSITMPNAPGIPTGLTRSVGNAGSKTFSWSAPTSGGTVVSYQYQLNSLGWTNNGSSTSVSLTGLSGSNTFQVRAVGSSLTGTAASTGSFTIPTINSGPTSSSVTSSSATISWTSTNQNSWSLSGVGSHTGTSETSKSVTLSASTSYTPSLTITSSTTDTATANGTQFTTPAQSFTVIFNENGGTGTMANQTANTATNLTAFGFTAPAGKGFSGWASSSSGSVIYTNQQSYPFTSSTTLWAIYYTLPTAPSQPSPSSSNITQTSATVSWTAPADGGSAITRYEAQLVSGGYSNIGLVLTQNISGLTAGTQYTYFVRAVNAIGTSTSGSVTFTTTAAPVIPSVTQIQSTNTNAGPNFMSFAITCANAVSCDVRVDRAASSTTAPTSNYTAGTSTLLTLTGNTGTVNSSTTAAPAGSNVWYRIRVIPYTLASRQGTAGTQIASSWKRNTATSTTTTNPSPTPFGNASV